MIVAVEQKRLAPRYARYTMPAYALLECISGEHMSVR
jgi:hypothetical protein